MLELAKEMMKDKIYVCYDNLIGAEYLSINALETCWWKRYRIIREATQEDIEHFNSWK